MLFRLSDDQSKHEDELRKPHNYRKIINYISMIKELYRK